MKAVIFGAGNIGRGFIGMTFSRSGYFVSFIDVNQDVVRSLNQEGRYPVDVVSNDGRDRIWVGPVQGVDGRDLETVANEIATCDLMATAVGVRALELIIPSLLAGIRKRWQTQPLRPLNIILCENLIHADTFVRDRLIRELSPAEQQLFTDQVGLVMASIGRMVPAMTPEQKQEHPLLVQVEPYDTLPIDGAAYIGTAPPVQNLILSTPFDSVVHKKLYLHNMGHAVGAYLGMYASYQYIYESMADPWIYLCVQNAMMESVLALHEKYADAGLRVQDLVAHTNDLTFRFQNKALQDTNERIGADPARKLSPQDRLIGAASLALEMGLTPVYIGLGIAAGISRLEQQQDLFDLDDIFKPLLSFDQGPLLIHFIRSTLDRIHHGASISQLAQSAELERARVAQH